jgi:hypothetical protein
MWPVLGFMVWVPNTYTMGIIVVVVGRTCWWVFMTSSLKNYLNLSSTNGQHLNKCPTYWQYEQVTVLAPWFPLEKGLWCETCDLSFRPGTDLINQVPCGYVTPCLTTVGVAQGSTCFKCGIETDWFRRSLVNLMKLLHLQISRYQIDIGV